MTKAINNIKVDVVGAPGTGTITVGNPLVGFQSISDAGFSDGDTVNYKIQDGIAWEIGDGTWNATAKTITRGPVESSNADAAINASSSAVVQILGTGENVPLAQRGAASGVPTLDANSRLTATQQPKVDKTFATLPATNLQVGDRYVITDCNANTFLGSAAGGGSYKVPVFWDGSAWKIG